MNRREKTPLDDAAYFGTLIRSDQETSADGHGHTRRNVARVGPWLSGADNLVITRTIVPRRAPSGSDCVS
jgi:hypothetical protein